MQEINVLATVDNLGAVIAFINAELKKMRCGQKTISQLDIAVDELFGNIARYGYEAEGGPVIVRIERTTAPAGVTVTFIDRGVPFNPLSASAPDLTLKPRQRPIGGLGIYMVKKTMDAVEYARENGRNRLTISKYFKPSGDGTGA